MLSLKRCLPALVLFGSSLLLLGCGSASTATSSSPSASTPAATVHLTPQSSPHQLQWQMIEHFSGSGNKKTAIFSVPDDWKLLYTCKASTLDGVVVENFIAVTLYDSQNNIIDVPINAMCKNATKDTVGETEEHQAGSVYLDVSASGDWTLHVEVQK